MKRILLPLLVTCLVLQSCGSTQEQTEPQTKPLPNVDFSTINVSGAKAGLTISRWLSEPMGYTSNTKPSSTLGIYSVSYLAQGSFRVVRSAIVGIEAQMQLIAGQQKVATDEIFSLMTQYGTVLQVDLQDVLNRSNDREKALDGYLTTLNNLTKLMQQKENEMKTAEETLEQKRRSDKKAVQVVDRKINDAFRNEQFEVAASEQEQLAELEGILTKTEINLKQNTDMQDRFEDLLKIGVKRSEAITANRRILIAGLKVVDVPGIDEFNLIEKP